MAEVFIASTIGAEGFSRRVAIKRVLPGYSENPQFAPANGGMRDASAGLAARIAHGRRHSRPDGQPRRRRPNAPRVLGKRKRPGVATPSRSRFTVFTSGASYESNRARRLLPVMRLS